MKTRKIKVNELKPPKYIYRYGLTKGNDYSHPTILVYARTSEFYEGSNSHAYQEILEFRWQVTNHPQDEFDSKRPYGLHVNIGYQGTDYISEALPILAKFAKGYTKHTQGCQYTARYESIKDVVKLLQSIKAKRAVWSEIRSGQYVSTYYVPRKYKNRAEDYITAQKLIA